MTEQIKKEWVDWQNTKVLQKAVVIDEQGNMLAIRRSEAKPGGRPGKWDLPGGSVGPDDLVEGTQPHIEVIKREIKEETGLETQEVEPVFVDSWVFTKSPGKILGVAIGYRCKVSGVTPEVRLSEEHIESTWGNKKQIMALDFGEDGGLHPSIIKRA
ncbi:MAG: NUDIX domain-containing protein [Candidatus Sifarchaeia archaeon]|jgi:8-oxo-dGTP pyrophosphatase MutT (NUDIX family)